MTRSVFFGYPASPRSEAAVVRTVAEDLETRAGITSVTWESLGIDGRIVLSEILSAIDSSSMAILDMSTLNSNVLFEAGYAIARGKPVWLTIDSTSSPAKKAWQALCVARDIGFTPYRNSVDLVERFIKNDPITNLESIYDTVIETSLPDREMSRDGLLYCTTFEPFEAANRLNSFIEGRQRRSMRVAFADPAESSVLPLRWYVQEMARSTGTVVHFAGQHRNHAALHNNRHAFVAGLALGLEIPLLLLAESDYQPPFDYESLLRIYETAEECIEDCREWLDQVRFEGPNFAPRKAVEANPLAALRFGEHVAENERSELGDYFIETSAYVDVIASRDSIFIGHRGTGKTANAIQAFTRLAADKRNLAVLIKPPGFEFPAMLAVVNALPSYQHDFFFDALWRFAIQTDYPVRVHVYRA